MIIIVVFLLVMIIKSYRTVQALLTTTIGLNAALSLFPQPNPSFVDETSSSKEQCDLALVDFVLLLRPSCPVPHKIFEISKSCSHQLWR